jgi:hypothetical protein
MRKVIGVAVTLVVILMLASPANAGGTRHFEGRFSGEGFFKFFTGRCPFMDQVFDYVLTREDRRAGTMHAEACATIVDNFYSAEGTFTIRLPDGTFSGTYLSQSQLPPSLPTIPIPHTITSGTGDFRRATGTCGLILEANVNLEFGHQLQAGTWSCDVRTK